MSKVGYVGCGLDGYEPKSKLKPACCCGGLDSSKLNKSYWGYGCLTPKSNRLEGWG